MHKIKAKVQKFSILIPTVNKPEKYVGGTEELKQQHRNLEKHPLDHGRSAHNCRGVARYPVITANNNAYQCSTTHVNRGCSAGAQNRQQGAQTTAIPAIILVQMEADDDVLNVPMTALSWLLPHDDRSDESVRIPCRFAVDRVGCGGHMVIKIGNTVK